MCLLLWQGPWGQESSSDSPKRPSHLLRPHSTYVQYNMTERNEWIACYMCLLGHAIVEGRETEVSQKLLAGKCVAHISVSSHFDSTRQLRTKPSKAHQAMRQQLEEGAGIVTVTSIVTEISRSCSWSKSLICSDKSGGSFQSPCSS